MFDCLWVEGVVFICEVWDEAAGETSWDEWSTVTVTPSYVLIILLHSSSIVRQIVLIIRVGCWIPGNVWYRVIFFPGPWFRVVLSFVNFKSDKAIIFFNSIPFTPFQSLDGKYKVQKIPNFVLWMLFHVLLVYKHGWIHYNPIKDCIQFMFIWIAANIYAFVELECGWEWMRQATTMTEN